MTRRLAPSVAAAALATLVAALLLLPALAEAKPGAGPQLAKCGKLKKKGKKARFRKCLKQNKANRIAFRQLKDSRLVGERGDGEEVEDVYCANGKWESRLTGRYGTGVSTGRWWRIADARVRNGGKWINAFLRGPEGYEIGLQRRGSQWRYGIATFDRIEDPGDVTKTDAAKECRTLEV
jgi:hypothetical protein